MVRVFVRICQHLKRDHHARQPYSQRDEDEIIEVAKDGDEIGKQIDRAEGVSYHRGRPFSGGSWHAQVPVGEVEG